jgi:hypothetical protein
MIGWRNIRAVKIIDECLCGGWKSKALTLNAVPPPVEGCDSGITQNTTNQTAG